jgi:hypothetical protein
MAADLTARVEALEQASKRQFRYTAILIILVLLTIVAVSVLSLRLMGSSKAPTPVKAGS